MSVPLFDLKFFLQLGADPSGPYQETEKGSSLEVTEHKQQAEQLQTVGNDTSKVQGNSLTFSQQAKMVSGQDPKDPKLKSGPDPKDTLLMTAVRKMDSRMVGILLNHGVPLNAVNSRGETAFDIAKELNLEEIIKMFQEKVPSSESEITDKTTGPRKGPS